MSRRELVAPLAVVGIAVAFAAWMIWSTPPKTPDHADLVADPAFALRPPDSDQLLEVGDNAFQGIDGGYAAFAGHVFGTTMSSAEVYAWYERELARLGWRIQPPPYSRGSAEIENRLYCRPGASFRLAIDDKTRAFQPALYKGKDYTTVFDATLIAADPRSACPRPPLTPFPTAAH